MPLSPSGFLLLLKVAICLALGALWMSLDRLGSRRSLGRGGSPSRVFVSSLARVLWSSSIGACWSLWRWLLPEPGSASLALGPSMSPSPSGPLRRPRRRPAWVICGRALMAWGRALGGLEVVAGQGRSHQVVPSLAWMIWQGPAVICRSSRCRLLAEPGAASPVPGLSTQPSVRRSIQRPERRPGRSADDPRGVGAWVDQMPGTALKRGRSVPCGCPGTPVSVRPKAVPPGGVRP